MNYLKLIVLILGCYGFSLHVSAQTPKNGGRTINDAEQLWMDLNIDQLKKELQNQLQASDEDFALFLSIHEDYLHAYRHHFFELVLENKLSKKDFAAVYQEILKQSIAAYKQFEPTKEQLKKGSKQGNDPVFELKTGGCVNADFEEGTTNGWDGFAGTANSSPNPSGLVPSFSRITVLTGSGFDNIVGGNIIPHVAPGGTFSVRLEDQSTGSKASRLSQTFQVQPNNANFTYRYAVVLENGNHGVGDQAYFKVKIKDQNGVQITCISDSLTPTSPFTNLTSASNGIYYRNWTTKSIPLGNYIGQNVTIEFTVSDCDQGGHLGYAYIDGSCLPLEIQASVLQICPGISSTLTAPSGYDSYFWTGPGIVGNNTSQLVTVNQPGTYQVNVFKGNCSSPVVINLTGGGITASTSQLCSGDTTTLYAPAGFTSYAWTGPGIVGSSSLPQALVNQPGTYNLTITGGLGSLCASSYTLSPIIQPLAGPDVTICLGDTVQLNVSGGSSVFQWTPNTSMLLSNTPHPIVHPLVTTTYIATSCNVSDTIVVVVRNNITGTTTGDVVNCNSFGVPIGINMNGFGNYTYSWTPSTYLNTSNTASVVASPVLTTVYRVDVTLGNNCSYSDSIKITVPLISSFFATPEIDSICVGKSVQLNAIYYKGCGLNGTICSGATNNAQLGTSNTTSATTNATIYSGSAKSARFQMLIKKAELNALGIINGSTIGELGFQISSVSGSNIYQNFTIKMGCTSLTSLSTSYESGLSEVFSPQNVILNTGINTYQLDQTFDWDGNSNILVEVCYNNISSSANSAIFYTTSSFSSFLATSSSTPACNISTGQLSSNRPNIFFNYCTSPVLNGITYAWTPASTLTSPLSANPIATPTAETMYFVTAIDSVSGCIYKDSVSILVGDFFSLNLLDSIVNCNSQGVMLNVTPSQSGNYTYAWTPTATLDNPTISNPISTTSTTTTYFVTAISDIGCSIEDSIKIVVPTLSSFYITPEFDTICNGQSVQINSVYQKSCGVNGSTCSGASTAIQMGSALTNSTANSTTIYKGSSNGSRIQLLYKKSELIAAGLTNSNTLSHIGFNISGIVGNNIYQNFTIKMTCTSDTVLTATFQEGLQTVFNTKNVILSFGVNYYLFDNTFDWDGNSNLLVEICYNNASTSSNSGIFYSTTSNNMVRYTTGNLVCAATNGLLTTSRPNTYFKYCTPMMGNVLDFQWTPSADLSNDLISNPVASPIQNVTYYVSAIDSSNGCVFNDSISIVVNQSNLLKLNNDTLLCTGQSMILDAGSGYASYLWSNGSSGTTLLVSGPGTYWVQVTNSCGILRDSCIVGLQNIPASLNLGPDSTICSGSQLLLNAFDPLYTTYLWSDGSFSSSYTATQSGTLTLTASNQCGSNTDSIQLNFANPIPVNLGNDTTLCAGPSLTLDAGAGYDSYLWNDGTSAQTLSVSTSGIYTVSVTSLCGNSSDSVSIIFNTVPNISLGVDTTFCPGFSTQLSPVGCSNCTYIWQDNSSGNTLSVNSNGNYSVSATNECGIGRDTIVVSTQTATQVHLGNDTLLCQSGSLVLDAGISNSSYLWSNGTTNRTLSVSSSGIYIVSATNSCGISSDTISVSIESLPNIDLGPDISFCVGSTIQLNPIGCVVCSYVWQDNSSGTNFNATSGGTYFVTASNQCGLDRDTIQLSAQNPQTVDLGNDTSLCQLSTLILDAGISNSTYLWNNGTTNQTMTISLPGNYFVRVTNVCGVFSDTILVTSMSPPDISLGNDTSFCSGTTVLLTPGACSNCSYTWQDNSSDAVFEATQAGTYSVVATNNCGTDRDTIQLVISELPIADLGPDTAFCLGQSIVISTPFDPDYQYLWHNALTTNSIGVITQGTYWVRVTNDCGSVYDTLLVLPLFAPPVFSLGNDATICENATIQLNAPPNCTYLWQDNSQNQSLMVSDGGLYWVALTDSNSCVARDSIVVSVIYNPLISLGNDLSFCEGTTHTLQLPNNSNNYVWQDGSTENYFVVSQTGIYTVTASNQCGSVSDVVLIEEKNCSCNIDVPTAFSPNGDQSNEILYVRGNCVSQLDFYIYNRWGEKVFETHDITQGWDGTYQDEKLGTDVFYYYLSAVLIGNTEKIERKGNISLVK